MSYAGMCIASLVIIDVDELWSIDMCQFLYLALQTEIAIKN